MYGLVSPLYAGRTKNSYDYLIKGMGLGEATGDKKVIGYACVWLTYACGEVGLITEGIFLLSQMSVGYYNISKLCIMTCYTFSFLMVVFSNLENALIMFTILITS